MERSGIAHLIKSAALLAGIAAPAQTGQPISESMVQCGALYSVAAEWVSEGPGQERLLHAADVWAQAAYARAEHKGRTDPENWVSGMWRSKCNGWYDHGAGYVFTQDFRDWTAYCRALARHEGLETDPD
ncbi:hypothetical protein [uncultured Roseobacter sp.]|uniref:hypothetical protein n=1 Tax=uncultured Roseobacter sp. TaxID=114847 RepID=UPI00261064B3|nr:hypothetical protein [uncultured Roseobacter sp.]